MRNTLLTYRRVVVVAAHAAMWTAAFLGAFLLRFDFAVPRVYFASIPKWLFLLLAARGAVHAAMGLFQGLWRYSSASDLTGLVKASVLSSALFSFIVLILGPTGLPRSVLVMDWLGSVVIVGGVRFSIRALREAAVEASRSGSTDRKRLLVVGAGDAGEMLVREITRTKSTRYVAVGFIDDNVHKQGDRIHGVPVLGKVDRIVELVDSLKIDEVIIAIPSLGGREMRRIHDMCKRTTANVRTLPGFDRLIEGRVSVSQLQSVKIDDLLGREAVQLDSELVSEFVRARVILVSGAGGSIGSELCRQIARFGPRKILLIERAENSLFHIHRLLIREFPDVAVSPLMADIVDADRMREIFLREAPEVVFHAAAHKHVPMMEENPGEAIKNNVFGTKLLADIAHEFHAEKFVMVSTDKAVNPSSVMGVSKRAAEIYVQALSQRSTTQFVTVRFGNVLGSAGSVIPLFQEQIAAGGPVTVTHPDMRRYFMTIPEASQLILQAGAMGSGGEIFVLDMGEPVKIVDLARDLIALSGLSHQGEIEIKFTGMRPGEKLFEELATDDEHADKTKHPKIFIGRFRPHAWEKVQACFAKLASVSDGTDRDAVKVAFAELVPEYTGATASLRERRTPPPSGRVVEIDPRQLS